MTVQHSDNLGVYSLTLDAFGSVKLEKDAKWHSELYMSYKLFRLFIQVLKCEGTCERFTYYNGIRDYRITTDKDNCIMFEKGLKAGNAYTYIRIHEDTLFMLAEELEVEQEFA